MKRKLFFLLSALLLGLGNASADVWLETDLTSQFNSLATNAWVGSSGQVGWAAPKVTTNSGLTVAAWERYNGSCYWTGDIMHTTVTGLVPGTYKIELYGAAAFTFGRGFGSEAFTGSQTKDQSDTYTEGQSIIENTGVYLYANTSEGEFKNEIPIWYATNFNASGLSTVALYGVEVGENGQIVIGMSKESNSTNWHVVQLKGVTATVSGDATIAKLKAEAEALLTNPIYVNVTGVERISLQAAYDATPAEETVEAYQAVISALNTAIPTFENCDVAAYNKYVAELDKAAALGLDVSEYGAATSASNATQRTQVVMVDEYAYVTTNYEYGVGLGTWTTVNATDRSGQHWDGSPTSSYSEQNEGWGSSSWECSYSQYVSLPAGKYVFKVAGRKSSDNAILTLKVTNGDEIIGLVNDFPNGDTGKGIDTGGATNFGEGTFAYDGAGRGWQWRYVPFTLENPATVNVAVTASANAQYQWVGFCNATVQTDDEDNIAIMEALVNLNSAITVAEGLTKNTANVGTGAFQFNETTNNDLWSAFETAKSNAENFELTSTSTVEEINLLIEALAIAAYNYRDQTLNAPDAEQRYAMALADRGTLTFVANEGTVGGFDLNFYEESANKPQSFFWTQVSGNDYTLSFVDAEGTTHYICTGEKAEAGLGNDRIRTTTSSEDALVIRISATSTDNVFNMLNTEDGNKKMGSNGGGLYTTDDYTSWSIAEASKATANLTVENGKLGTFVAPFEVTLPLGVKAYSAEVSGDKVQLTKIAEGGGILDAGTPVIVYGDKVAVNENFDDFSVLNGNKTVDALTGILDEDDKTVPVGAYVLQTQTIAEVETQAFYKLGEDATGKLNRCYVTAASSEARLTIELDEATIISAIEAAEANGGELKDGKYFIGNKVVIVKNAVKYGANGQILK